MRAKVRAQSPDAFEIIHCIGAAQHRKSYVSHRYSTGGDALFLAVMGMAVNHEVGAAAIYGFGQKVTSEEGVYFQALAGNGVFDGRIVEQCDSEVALEFAQ